MQSVDGLVVDGDVTNHAGGLNKILAIQLYSKQLAAAGSSANGLSGAPVIINKMVAGVLRSALGKKGPGCRRNRLCLSYCGCRRVSARTAGRAVDAEDRDLSDT